VVGPAAQGITPGNFAALVVALESNTACGNIYTTTTAAATITIEPQESAQIGMG